MGWDEVINGWTSALDDIDHAIDTGDWDRLEAIQWPEPEAGLDPPTLEQRRKVEEISRRQLAAIGSVQNMLDEVGRELREAAKLRGAARAYGASSGQ